VRELAHPTVELAVAAGHPYTRRCTGGDARAHRLGTYTPRVRASAESRTATTAPAPGPLFRPSLKGSASIRPARGARRSCARGAPRRRPAPPPRPRARRAPGRAPPRSSVLELLEQRARPVAGRQRLIALRAEQVRRAPRTRRSAARAHGRGRTRAARSPGALRGREPGARLREMRSAAAALELGEAGARLVAKPLRAHPPAPASRRGSSASTASPAATRSPSRTCTRDRLRPLRRQLDAVALQGATAGRGGSSPGPRADTKGDARLHRAASRGPRRRGATARCARESLAKSASELVAEQIAEATGTRGRET